jgi:CDP-glucose 4,6-dehydratase
MEGVVTPSPDFWAKKRVLVLGHTGFKGAWLSLWLRGMGADVFGISLPPPAGPNLFTDARLDTILRSTFADIRDIDSVMRNMREIKPEIVLHLAAQALVRPSYVDPIGTYATNVMGTVHVLAAAQAIDSVRSVVIVTSDKCYENREWFWAYREDEPMGGHDPYSSSKGCAELVTAAWRRSYGGPGAKRHLGIGSARAGNVIGGGDWGADRLLPDCIRALIAGKAIDVRNPHATRPWQHVLDPLCGYLILAQRLWADPVTYGEGWNFGPVEEDAKPVAWIATKVVDTWGGNARWQSVTSESAPHEATFLKVDASKARSRLRWSQRLRLNDGLEWTVAWYRKFVQGDSARALAEEQIGRFCSISVNQQ